MKHTILIFSQAMELGGVERSLLGLLDSDAAQRRTDAVSEPQGKAPAGNSAVCLAGRAHGVARQERTTGRAARAAERKACGTAL